MTVAFNVQEQRIAAIVLTRGKGAIDGSAISDGMNVTLNVTPNAASALVKYFKNLFNLAVDGALIALKSGMSLADPALKSVSSGVTFAQPVVC